MHGQLSPSSVDDIKMDDVRCFSTLQAMLLPTLPLSVLQVNHISPESEEFQGFLADGDKSKYADMFIDWEKFWPQGTIVYHGQDGSMFPS